MADVIKKIIEEKGNAEIKFFFGKRIDGIIRISYATSDGTFVCEVHK